MRKVIKGKTYDTDTAIEVARYETDRREKDMRYFNEKLYRTRTNNYFLCGRGGGLTKYAKFNDCEKHIIPLTELEAVQWCIDSKRKDPLRGCLAEAYANYQKEDSVPKSSDFGIFLI
jgi:hypothetical protein